jgi:hypothetical protein
MAFMVIFIHEELPLVPARSTSRKEAQHWKLAARGLRCKKDRRGKQGEQGKDAGTYG